MIRVTLVFLWISLAWAQGQVGIGTALPSWHLEVYVPYSRITSMTTIHTSGVAVSAMMPQNSQQGILGYHLVNSSLPYAWRVWYADPDGGYGVGALNLEIWEYPDLQGGGPCCRRRFRIETTYPSTTFGINPVSLDAQNRLHAYGFTNLSDSALKSRIRPLEEGTLEKVRSLQPVLYRWKGDTRQQLGFIAQKTHAILPEVIRPNHTLMGIDYAALTAILYRSVQELSCKIEDLENAIQLLEKDLAKYE